MHIYLSYPNILTLIISQKIDLFYCTIFVFKNKAKKKIHNSHYKIAVMDHFF